MRVLAVHPGCLMYSKIYLRLEPLGLELAAAAARQAGHEVRLIDLQVETPEAYFRLLERWRPEAIGFSLNYLANVPEVLDLVQATRERLPDCFIFVGGHSASFTAQELLAPRQRYARLRTLRRRRSLDRPPPRSGGTRLRSAAARARCGDA